ncbi:aspartyl/asparaginyl beta-hydroxylase domain-containing protein [Agrobacterium tumefaciens]|uniref:aspartyl/asparaginyl beta-hydroxylase domain-containing protein n=1 Tax=Agrobacterium tumefaciens TaxID=358 RepID=UPI001573BA02|nr:aspartyl/asparaginyl beta-hydroxylase domain-containing protein [Agrobacterium tumefaciens]
MFYDVDVWPEADRLAGAILESLGAMREHYAEVSGSFTTWPEPLHGGGWSVFPFKWQGVVVNDLFPWVRDELVLNAGYSRMAPGTVIEPHQGYTSDVLRMHVGLFCPAGDCSIQVGQEVRHWRNGEVLLLDDTVMHSARNLTDSDRVILLLDLLK